MSGWIQIPPVVVEGDSVVEVMVVVVVVVVVDKVEALVVITSFLLIGVTLPTTIVMFGVPSALSKTVSLVIVGKVVDLSFGLGV